jgi:WASH complex subunit strumpellin
MLFVLLYFEGRILHEDSETMKEIVTKHFNDNWVIVLFQGFIIDIVDYWQSCKAAKGALATAITFEKIRELSVRYKEKNTKLNKKLFVQIKEGVVTDVYVLEKTQKILQLLRNANVTIRWFLLHKNTKIKKLKEIILAHLNEKEFLNLILRTSEFENQFKLTLESLVDSKAELLEKDKAKSMEHIIECGEYFAGNRNLGKVIKEETYERWFKDFANQISSINYKHSTSTQRKIHSFIQALENISQYPLIDTNPQIKFFVLEVVAILRHMGKIAMIKKQDLVNVSLISDFSYAWNLLDDYLTAMHNSIKTNTGTVLLLRSCFLKLASILNLPLVRMIESNSPDLMNVSQFYSNELVQFVSRVLSIIPKSIFELLRNIRKLISPKMRARDAKIPKEELFDYALLDERFKLAEFCHRISLFAQGMLTMDKCLMGIIEVDPKKLLINGIRNQIIKTISSILHKGFVFKKVFCQRL